jgi:hypothetical protein
MKLSLSMLILASLLALTNCSTNKVTPPTVKAPVIKIDPVPKQKSTNNEVDRSDWRLTLPNSGWIVKPGEPQVAGVMTFELEARTLDDVGSKPIGLLVATVSLGTDDVDDEEFPQAAVVDAARKLGPVMQAGLSDVDGHRTSYAVMLTPDGNIVGQAAVAVNRKGFIVRCGGDTDEADVIAKTCTAIIDSFHVK